MHALIIRKEHENSELQLLNKDHKQSLGWCTFKRVEECHCVHKEIAASLIQHLEGIYSASLKCRADTFEPVMHAALLLSLTLVCQDQASQNSTCSWYVRHGLVYTMAVIALL